MLRTKVIGIGLVLTRSNTVRTTLIYKLVLFAIKFGAIATKLWDREGPGAPSHGFRRTFAHDEYIKEICDIFPRDLPPP